MKTNPLPSLAALLACAAASLPLAACARETRGPDAATRADPTAPPATRAETPAHAATDAIEARIALGRAELAAGRPAEAERIFADAARADGDSLRTRTWVIRSWLPQGRINDALDAIDALERGGARGPALDYLYGMAFSAKAQDYEAKDVSPRIAAMSYADAVEFLARATAAEPELYSDAFAGLANAAWNMGKLEVAGSAIVRARELDPSNARLALLAGRIALARHAAAAPHAGEREAADGHWEAARAALEQALEAFTREEAAGRPERRVLAAQSAKELGHTFAFQQRGAEAAAAYARAIGLDPGTVDLRQVRDTLGDEAFLAALEEGSRAFTARHGAESQDDAALRWWLGWARLQAGEHERAEEALLQALAKNPSFANAWWYVALSRYRRDDFAGAVAALRSHWEANASDLASTISEDPGTNLPIVRWLAGWCAREKRSLEGAMLSETLGALEPGDADHWNNAGLFWRDHGEALRKSARPEEQALAMQIFEHAYVQYTRALELQPDNPGLLNDVGVMLHYCLDRELDTAAELYARATEKALEKLAEPDLPADRREWFDQALRDSRANTVALRELVTKRATEAASGAPAAEKKPD